MLLQWWAIFPVGLGAVPVQWIAGQWYVLWQCQINSRLSQVTSPDKSHFPSWHAMVAKASIIPFLRNKRTYQEAHTDEGLSLLSSIRLIADAKAYVFSGASNLHRVFIALRWLEDMDGVCYYAPTMVPPSHVAAATGKSQSKAPAKKGGRKKSKKSK